MFKRNIGMNTICTHTGAVEDVVHGGAVSPIYMSTSYDFIYKSTKRYPRYFNTPNQELLAKFPSTIKIELNKETKLYFDLTQVSLFDSITQERI